MARGHNHAEFASLLGKTFHFTNRYGESLGVSFEVKDIRATWNAAKQSHTGWVSLWAKFGSAPSRTHKMGLPELLDGIKDGFLKEEQTV